jgi:hypothetical protein
MNDSNWLTRLFVVLIVLVSVSMSAAAKSQSAKTSQDTVIEDGDYVAREKIPHPIPGDRNAAGFHKNTLVIRNNNAILEKVPVCIRDGKEDFNCDGNFLTYRAKFARKDAQVIVSLRLFNSRYEVFPAGKHDQYTEIKTYPVTILPGQIEFAGVRYKANKAETWKLDWLLPLLAYESLESSDANLPSIVVDSVTTSDPRELMKAADALGKHSCNGGYDYMEHPTTVGESVGGKVKTIRVVRRALSAPASIRVAPDEIRQKIKRVWQGRFQGSSCQIMWAEPTIWSIEAVLEFEDGKRSPLITDGWHVALQDHKGDSHFFRLSAPAL